MTIPRIEILEYFEGNPLTSESISESDPTLAVKILSSSS